MSIVTRFAPSPTGYIHIGNVRSAIFPYLVARQKQGKFILRIEDTDRKRYVEGATDLIEETLKWLGLNWDEGPDIGGPHAPYYQTQRQDLYLKYAKKLLSQGRAYADPTSPDLIQQYREADAKNKTAFLYRNHRPKLDVAWQKGIPLRFKADPKTRSYHDAVFGEQTLLPETQDDIILIKADGLPTYNFAHIIDDLEMEVSHVFRGQEYLPSMGNYLALYEALQITPPQFVHLPHILAPQGNKKLSKRDGAKSVNDYRHEGFLPEAILNFLACLGWNDGSTKELYSKDQLIQDFQIERIQRTPARFDEKKLIWLNGQWIRKLYLEDKAKLYEYSLNFWPSCADRHSKADRIKVLDIIYDRLKTLSDLKTMTAYFFEEPSVDLKFLLENKFIQKIQDVPLSQLLDQSITRLEALPEWTLESLTETTNALLKETGRKPAELFSLLRIALSFAPFSPALPETMLTLGREATIKRLQKTLNALQK